MARAVGRVARLPGAGKRQLITPVWKVDAADDVVADVADEEVALGIKLDAVRLVELGLGGGAAVATNRAGRCRRWW